MHRQLTTCTTAKTAAALACTLAISMMAGGVHAASHYYRGTAVYSLADKAMQTGQYASAETMATAALSRNPGNARARAALGLAQAELFKLDAAEKNAQMILNKDPKNGTAWMVKGVVDRNRTASMDMTYRSRKEALLAQSAQALEKAASLEPHSPEIYNQLGVTYRLQGRDAQARSAFEKALDLDPGFAEALVNEGIMKLGEGDINGAKANYNKAIKLNSKNYLAHYRLGEALLAGGDAHGALQSLNTALALSPNNAEVMAQMAQANVQQGNTAAAVANYQKAIHANPAFMPAYTGLANLFDNRGDGELAMAELKSALNVNPKYAPAKDQLGRLALSVDKPDQAMQYYQAALRDNPNDAEALQGLSQTLMVVAQNATTESEATGMESNLVNAEQAVNEALRLNPNDLRLHLAQLRIAQLDGKPEASEQELEQIVNTPAKNESDQMIQGEALQTLGRYSESDAVFRDLMARSGRDTGKLLVIGDTLKADGDLDLAREAYQQVAAIDPGNLKAQRGVHRIDQAEEDSQKSLRLAKALNHFWQKQSSVDFYEDTLSKNPRQPEARLALAKLYERYKQYDKAALSYQLYLGLEPDLKDNDRAYYQRKIDRLHDEAHTTQ